MQLQQRERLSKERKETTRALKRKPIANRRVKKIATTRTLATTETRAEERAGGRAEGKAGGRAEERAKEPRGEQRKTTDGMTEDACRATAEEKLKRRGREPRDKLWRGVKGRAEVQRSENCRS
jgi:hypothetical protein